MATKIRINYLAVLIISFASITQTVWSFLDIEELKSIHYGIEILNVPVLWTTEEDMFSDNSIKVTSKHGQNYKCSFPDRVEADKKKEEEEKVAMEMGIPELLKPLESGPCLFKNKDWWSYEFCYGKHIRQFHIEDGKIVGEVTFLGYYESEFDWNNETDTEKKSRHNNRLNRYHSQNYINGTVCDLTQKQRKTEVRFLCDDSSGDYIGRIDEPETCAYVLTVYTSKICHHPYLRPPTKNIPVPITCNPVLLQNQYSEYLQEVKEENDRLEEEMEKQKKEKEELEKKLEKSKIESTLTKLTENIKTTGREEQAVDKTEIESDLNSEQKQVLEDKKNLDAMLEKTVGDNEELEKLLKTSLDKEMEKYVKDLGVQKKDMKFKVIKSLDDLRDAMKEVALETEALLTKKVEKAQSQQLGLTEEKKTKKDVEPSDEPQSMKEEQQNEEDTKSATGTDLELSEDEQSMIEEFDKGLDDMDLTNYKELFQQNRERFAAVKKKIQENMRAQFDDILKEAGDELGIDKEKLDIEKQNSFAEMADTLNKLLLKLENTEKDIQKVNKELSDLQELEQEQDTKKTGDDSTAVTAPQDDSTAVTAPQDDSTAVTAPQNQVQGPKKSLDDRVKVRVTKLRRSEFSKMQKNSATDMQTQQLEKEVKNGLEKAGLDIGGGKIQVKIITAKYTDDDESSLHVLSDDETKAFTNMIVSILEGDDEVSKEEKKHSSMEEGYNFVWGKHKKKDSS